MWLYVKFLLIIILFSFATIKSIRSWNLSTPITLHAAFEMALNNSVAASKTSMIANEYDGSTSDLSTWLLHVGMSYAF